MFDLIGEKPEKIVCKGAKDLYDEAKEAIKEKPATEFLDGMLATGAMKTELYKSVA